MKYIDDKKICKKESCCNLGAWNKVINNKLYRSPLCEKHKAQKYGKKKSPASKLKTIEKFKKRGLANKCEICGWKGPCDVHRKIPQGSYNLKNIMSSCPNCHRLIHRDMMIVEPLESPNLWQRKK